MLQFATAVMLGWWMLIPASVQFCGSKASALPKGQDFSCASRVLSTLPSEGILPLSLPYQWYNGSLEKHRDFLKASWWKGKAVPSPGGNQTCLEWQHGLLTPTLSQTLWGRWKRENRVLQTFASVLYSVVIGLVIMMSHACLHIEAGDLSWYKMFSYHWSVRELIK